MPGLEPGKTVASLSGVIRMLVRNHPPERDVIIRHHYFLKTGPDYVTYGTRTSYRFHFYFNNLWYIKILICK